MELVTSEDYEESVRSIFEFLDFDKSGLIDFTVFKMGLESLGYKWPPGSFEQLKNKLLKEQAKGVPYEIFHDYYTTKVHPIDAQTDTDEVFRFLDQTNKQYITGDDLATAASELNLDYTKAEMDALINCLTKKESKGLSLSDIRTLCQNA